MKKVLLRKKVAFVGSAMTSPFQFQGLTFPFHAFYTVFRSPYSKF